MFYALMLTIALAQPPQGPPARDNQPAPALTDGELIGMLDTYAIVQAQNALQLDDAQYGQFVARLKRLQETRRRNLRLRHQILRDLRRMTAPGSAPDENAVRDRLKALRDHDERAADELRRTYDALDEILDPRRQALFRLFEERMEGRKLDLLMRARARAGRRGGG